MRILVLLLLASLGANAQYTNIFGKYDYKDSLRFSNYGRLSKKFDYNGNIRGTFTGFSLVDKGYTDSSIAANVNNIAIAWRLNGNANTIDVNHFIGTTDNRPFNIRVNNQASGRIDNILFNTFWGHLSGNSISTGFGNTGIGAQALGGNSTGYNNTGLGQGALVSNILGHDNTGLGYRANVSNGILVNATAIGANAYVSANNSLVLGGITGINSGTDTKVGIGVTAPTERLHVNGNFRLVNGSQAAGRFLQSDANGVSAWADLPAAPIPTWQQTLIAGSNLTQDNAIQAKGYKLNIDSTKTFQVSSYATETTSNEPIIKISNNFKLSDDINEGISSTSSLINNGSLLYQGSLNVGSYEVGLFVQNISDDSYSGLSINPDFASIYSNKYIYLDADSAVFPPTIPDIDSSRQLATTKWVKKNLSSGLSNYLEKNVSITGATKTKITYDTKGLVTAGADATTADIAEGSNLYFTEERAQDATGSMVDPTLVYNDGLPSLGRAAINGDIAISAGSNTAAISAGVIVDADINAAAGIDATKVADGSVTSAEFQYINSLTSNAQTQIDNKVTKGGDAGPITIGTTDATDLNFITNSAYYWRISSDGKLLRNIGSSNLGLHLGGTGVGSVIAFGDGFDANTPYLGFREHGGTDTDGLDIHGAQGLFFSTGAAWSTAKFTVKSAGTVIGGETPVSGAELTVVGNADVSGDLNVQGSGIIGTFVNYKNSTTPSSPAVGECNEYLKGGKRIYQYNDGGTIRYKYLDLTGTGVTWVHTLVAP